MLKNEIEAVILAGGKGSRLQPVVSDRPKPMAEVAGRPFIEWLVLSLREQGIRRVIFCTGFMSEVIERYFGNGNRWGMTFLYTHEPHALGTAGALRFALDQVTGDRFLALNGDSYCQADVAALYQNHLDMKARATLWLVRVEDSGRYGAVEQGVNSEILGFREKAQDRGVGLINAGVYLLEREIIAQIAVNKSVSIETHVFPSLIGHGLYGVVGDGPFLDIGTPESFMKAELFCQNHLARLVNDA